MKNRVITLIIDGDEIEIDLDEELEIHDVGEDQTRVPAQMAYWGEVWSNAKSENIRMDALYRHWRANMFKGVLEETPKMSDTKIKNLIESDGRFLELKDSIARAEKNVIVSHSIFESFKSKAAVLSSKGAMSRAIYERTGMMTRSSEVKEDGGAKTKEDDGKKEKMKRIFNKKKKRS